MNALSQRRTNPDLPQLVSVSNGVRDASIRALVDQFQRMAAAAPIRAIDPLGAEATVADLGIPFCSFAQRLMDPAVTVPEMIDDHDPDVTKLFCADCHMYYRVLTWPPDNFCRAYSTRRDLDSGTLSVTVRFHLKCHLGSTTIGVYGCRLCERNGNRTILHNTDGRSLPDHLSSEHSMEELEADPDLVVTRGNSDTYG
jgi:hypothetical protein